jgi:hypothetical protein
VRLKVSTFSSHLLASQLAPDPIAEERKGDGASSEPGSHDSYDEQSTADSDSETEDDPISAESAESEAAGGEEPLFRGARMSARLFATCVVDFQVGLPVVLSLSAHRLVSFSVAV